MAAAVRRCLCTLRGSPDWGAWACVRVHRPDIQEETERESRVHVGPQVAVRVDRLPDGGNALTEQLNHRPQRGTPPVCRAAVSIHGCRKKSVKRQVGPIRIIVKYYYNTKKQQMLKINVFYIFYLLMYTNIL